MEIQGLLHVQTEVNCLKIFSNFSSSITKFAYAIPYGSPEAVREAYAWVLVIFSIDLSFQYDCSLGRTGRASKGFGGTFHINWDIHAFAAAQTAIYWQENQRIYCEEFTAIARFRSRSLFASISSGTILKNLCWLVGFEARTASRFCTGTVFITASPGQ